MTPQICGAIASAFQQAVIDVLSEKALAALEKTGLTRLVVAGGVGANRYLRSTLLGKAGEMGATVFYPELEFCTDNGAMIAFAGAMRLQSVNAAGQKPNNEFTVKARWDLEMQMAPSAI
jgi:N6-L-threonylcarbamoyladenine synthase